jgi:4-diphosphocytidyl-2-C-methyl-D-erythritol kinase
LQAAAPAPAKINLWLEVVGKRADGYHDLSTLMLPVAVYDRVELETGLPDGKIRLECSDPSLPSGPENLAARAAERYLEASGWRTGVFVRLEKRIPAAAGLGGGSSDAGTVMALLNRLAPEPLGSGELREAARRVGADVPFFLESKPALATGIGERLEYVEGVPEYPLVLIKPPINVATGWVYGRIKLTRGSSNIRLSTLLARPWNLGPLLQNDLEAVTLEAHPVLGRIKQWFLDRGALGALMSGSGPTVFGVFEDRERAREAAEAAGESWRDCWVVASRAGSLSRSPG